MYVYIYVCVCVCMSMYVRMHEYFCKCIYTRGMCARVNFVYATGFDQ